MVWDAIGSLFPWDITRGAEMCFATAALIAGGIGAATSAVGAISQGEATGNEAKYQAQIATNNAQIAKQNAQYSAEAGSEQATIEGLKSANAGGRIKASQAANNVDVNSGSALKVQQGQRQAGYLDTLTAENNALLQAYGYKATAASDTAQAALDTQESEEAPIAGDIGAAGSLLGNASSLGFKWGPMLASAGAGG